MNEAIPMAQYFLICRELGEVPEWPGNLRNYHRLEDQCYAPSIADLIVWATINDHCRDEAFNHTNGDVILFKFLWAHIAKYFNMEVPSFSSQLDEEKAQINLGEWAKDKKEVWEKIVRKYGGNVDCFQVDSFAFLDWGLNPSVSITTPFMSTARKARKYGWNRHDDSYDAWYQTFRSYENAGILPKAHCFQ